MYVTIFKEHISNKLNRFTVTYETATTSYVIRYIGGDVSPVRVKAIYAPVEIEGNGILLRVRTR